MRENVFYYESTASTNTAAKQMAGRGARHGTVVIAGSQTGGKGRMGRAFFSPPGSGLYMSAVLRFDKVELVTPFAAVCVCEAIESLCGLKPRIKWVNDILLDGKKVCGILAEAACRAVIVGIGLNFTTRKDDFPWDLRKTATSLYPFGNAPITRTELAVEIINRLVLPKNIGGEVIAVYKSKMDMLGGKITVHEHGGSYGATALDVDRGGRLIVEADSGERRVLSAGDVTVRYK